MKPREKAVLSLAASFLALLFISAPLHADTIIVNDLTDSVSLTQIGTSVTISSNPCTGETCTFTLTHIDPTGGGSVTSFDGSPLPGFPWAVLPIGLIDPNYPLPPPPAVPLPGISDIIQFGSGADPFTVQVQFNSDGESPLFVCHLPVACIATENGLPQTVGVITWADGTTATVQVQSDISDVPEPSSLLLFGTGLVSLAGAVRRRLLG